MASTNVPVKTTSRAGTNLGTGTVMDTVNGNNFVNDGATELIVNNTDATTKVVTVAVAYTIDGNAVAGKPLSVGAGLILSFGPFPTAVYGKTVEITCPSALVKVTPHNIAVS